MSASKTSIGTVGLPDNCRCISERIREQIREANKNAQAIGLPRNAINLIETKIISDSLETLITEGSPVQIINVVT